MSRTSESVIASLAVLNNTLEGRNLEKLRAKFKLWLSSSRVEGVFGDGKWLLLKAIDTEGSLQAASKVLGISYRKAWGDLLKAEKHLRLKLVEKHRGGKSGGRTGLTATGKAWVKYYENLRSDIEKAAQKSYEKNIGRLINDCSA